MEIVKKSGEEFHKNQIEQYNLLKKETVIFSQLLDEKDSLINQLQLSMKFMNDNKKFVQGQLNYFGEKDKNLINAIGANREENIELLATIAKLKEENDILIKNCRKYENEIDNCKVELENIHRTRENSLKNTNETMQLKEEANRLKIELNEIRNNRNYNTLLKDYQAEIARRKRYYNEIIDLKGRIRVYCRIRPQLAKEKRESGTICVQSNPHDDTQIIVKKGDSLSKFDLDRVFNPNSSQEEIFNEIQPLIISCVDGQNVCIMAYGQTSAGKTFTMDGPTEDPGLSTRSLSKLLKEIKERQSDWTYQLTVSAFEIYNDRVRDLLSDKTVLLTAKYDPEDGVYLPDMTIIKVTTVDDINEIFTKGKSKRAVASTLMNEASSRSHQILTITVEGKNKFSNLTSKGVLYLVDLAGSERLTSQSEGKENDRIREAIAINYSLTCLGDVIYALRGKNSHVPYRNSRLTFVLKECLGGNSKTALIVNVAPNIENISETKASLMFAQKARGITTNGSSVVKK
ncbi:DgyrCDS11439 [Dimorphilus gyrociliatus]|uniref:Kinesin-like protein n=1 Tax=Dimorphilus gyrociliatus TaxID=2664684 RepID=A0A7I8W3B7_9ANNE|nr:DgyrCDS11439 [Dimorphilus gyrociliatus]